MYREKTPQNSAFLFMDFTDFACFGHGLDRFLKGPVSGESDKIREYVSNGRTFLKTRWKRSRIGVGQRNP